MTFVEAELLKPENRIIRNETYNTLIEYLQTYHKDGFEIPCSISINKKDVELENYDIELKDDDVIVLLHHQGVTAAAIGTSSLIFNYLAATAINIAISYALNKIFMPNTPASQSSLATTNAGQSSSVYSLNSQQNEAKRGSIIPIIYGRVRTYPALICPPYYRFEDNEEYLYQLMCIGQGKYDIEEMLISDTNVNSLVVGDFEYKKLEYDDFKTADLLKAKINDNNYKGLVKTIPDIDNLELRGTPYNMSMAMRFSGSTIEFFPYEDGSYPDISSLVNGSTIEIFDSISNNGTYIVDSVSGYIVTVQSHTFTTEPIDSTTIYDYLSGDTLVIIDNSISIYKSFPEDQSEARSPINVDLGSFFNISGTYSDGTLLQVTGESTDATFVIPNMVSQQINSNNVSITYHAKRYLARFETSYGQYKYDKPHIGFEVDVTYPDGVYDSDSSGNFLPRTTISNIYINNTLINATSSIYTVGNVDNNTIRKTIYFNYELNGFAKVQDNISISFKRFTPEPVSITSNDKTFITRVKFIEEDKSYEQLGDITLLWCKVKATNAINSIGQFSINSWVSRKDVRNDVKSVCEDLYTNNYYGARLPLSELEFEDTAKYGDWKNDGMYYFCEFTSTGIYNIQYFIENDGYYYGMQYFSSTPPPVNTPFIGISGLYFEIKELPTLGVNTAIRLVTYDVVNGAIDSQLTVYDAMQMVAKSNNYSLFPVGATLKLKHDTIKPIRTALYNETNIIKDSLKISYLFNEDRSTDSVKVTYRDSLEFKEQTKIYPLDGIYPETVELWGCTDDTIAYNMAKYLYKQDRSRRKTIEFKTDIQGLIPQFLDRIAISHSLPEWGEAGQILRAYNTTSIPAGSAYVELSCDYNLIDYFIDCNKTYNCDEPFFEYCPVTNPYNTIIFRDEFGNTSDELTFQIISNNTIYIEIAPSFILKDYDFEDFDKPFFSIGHANNIVKDYIVTSIKPSGSEVTIQCVNYDESIYI